MEHFEIACYTALAAAADKAGMTGVSDMCRNIIPDEQQMALALMVSRQMKSRRVLEDALRNLASGKGVCP